MRLSLAAESMHKTVGTCGAIGALDSPPGQDGYGILI